MSLRVRPASKGTLQRSQADNYPMRCAAFIQYYPFMGWARHAATAVDVTEWYAEGSGGLKIMREDCARNLEGRVGVLS